MSEGPIPSVETLLQNLQTGLRELLSPSSLMIGVHTGGVWLAERLHRALAIPSALGALDISFYRDDFSRVGLNPEVKGSHLPEDLEDREVILVDDVLHTGRTVRAALNEIFSYGRPARVRLAVLVDRNGRELPIQADLVGHHLNLAPDQYVKLTNDAGLALKVLTRSG